MSEIIPAGSCHRRAWWMGIAVAGLLGLFGAAILPSAYHKSATPAKPGLRDVRFLYRMTLSELPRDARRMRVWAPMPFTDTHQTLNGFRVNGPVAASIVEESEYGNRFLLFDLTPAAVAARDSITLEIEYRVSRRGYRVVTFERGRATTPAHAGMEKFLRPSGLIPVDGRIATEARAVAGTTGDPLLQARKLYDHIVESVRYDKSGTGWGRGDAVYACDIRQGNCTDFHSLFIGEARAIGIPARFVMGFPLPAGRTSGDVSGYHCWAEFFVDPHGWVPVDASEAHKDRSRQDELFGGLDANRVGFTVGRDIHLPGAEAGPLNYVIYPHVEIDGQIHSRVDVKFEFADEKPVSVLSTLFQRGSGDTK